MTFMQNKVSRRIALGTIAGGLATGAVLLRSLRGPGIPETKRQPYEKIEIPQNTIASALPRSEVRKAFEMLQTEREMWLKFRGIAANIDIANKPAALGEQAPKVLVNKGYVSLRFDLASTGSWTGEVAPANVQMVYSDTPKSDPIWSFGLASNASAEKFVGKEIESIRHALMYELLIAPMKPMISLSNSVIGKVLPGLWEVSRESTANSDQSTYVFHSNGKPLLGDLLPSVALADGHLARLIPRRQAGKPYPIFSFSDYVSSNGVFYPTKLSLAFAEHGETSQKYDSLDMTLSNITVAV